jgi:hypothetical protein
MPNALLIHRNRLHLLKVVQRLKICVPLHNKQKIHLDAHQGQPNYTTHLEEYPFLDPVRQERAPLVADVPGGGNGEDVVQFFERALFSLGEEEEDHDDRDDVQAGVEAKGCFLPESQFY